MIMVWKNWKRSKDYFNVFQSGILSSIRVGINIKRIDKDAENFCINMKLIKIAKNYFSKNQSPRIYDIIYDHEKLIE